MAKILITVPHPSFHGGVGNIFRILKLDQSPQIEYFHNTQENKSANIFSSTIMLFRYVYAVWNKSIVHLNPSFDKKAIIRDATLLFLCKILNKRSIVFFHGWDEQFEHQVAGNYLYRSVFSWLFSKADSYILLGAIFKEKLDRLGVRCRRVYYLPTVADDAYFETSDAEQNLDTKTFHLLFIAGFVALKGMDIVLQSFCYLQQLETHFHFKLTMAGDGPELAKCRRLVKEKDLKDVTFTGYVAGRDKHACFKNADLLFFPSMYSEGLPCVIMEGMLYGLAIVTRPIGGIPDWVKHEVNGWLSSSTDPKDFAEGILGLVSRPELLNRIKDNNRKIAINNFTPEKVRAILLDIYAALT